MQHPFRKIGNGLLIASALSAVLTVAGTLVIMLLESVDFHLQPEHAARVAMGDIGNVMVVVFFFALVGMWGYLAGLIIGLVDMLFLWAISRGTDHRALPLIGLPLIVWAGWIAWMVYGGQGPFATFWGAINSMDFALILPALGGGVGSYMGYRMVCRDLETPPNEPMIGLFI